MKDNEGADLFAPVARLPGVLQKAAMEDDATYVLETKSGQQFLFSGVDVINDEWITLKPALESVLDHKYTWPFLLDAPVRENAYAVRKQGLTIRIDCIAWAACET